MDKPSLKENILKMKKTINEIGSLSNYLRNTNDSNEKRMILNQIFALKNSLRMTNEKLSEEVHKISLSKKIGAKEEPLKKKEKRKKEFFIKKKSSLRKELTLVEKETLKRLKKGEEKIKKEKIKKPSNYLKTSNLIFSNLSRRVLKKNVFPFFEKNLIKTNLQVTPISYLSMMFLTTLISMIGGIILFFFFMFFNLSVELPIITLAGEGIGARFLKIFWLPFLIPITTFFLMYFYPSLEKKTVETQINQELPFTVIHMSAIAGSQIEPSKIFSIIISTKEYPYIEKEFIKIMNEINIYGYDLVTALRNIASNSPSRKLADLLNSLATAITSGGSLPTFFEKRAQSLLFEHRLEREKYTKTAETFMDIYISVVIAAPMILMLLLMMMKISGLGIPISNTLLTVLMGLGVAIINVIFIGFLNLKQPSE